METYKVTYSGNLAKLEIKRQEIIAALQQFDEGSKGDVFTDIPTEILYSRLAIVAEEQGYTAEDLILAVEEGF